MIQNYKNECFRLPKCITFSEAISLISWLETQIENHIKSTNCKEFTVKDLFGGNNYYWGQNGFPIQKLYDNRLAQYTSEGYSDPEDQAVHQAGIDLGWLFKRACHHMKNYTFKLRREFKQIVYEIISTNASGDDDAKEKGDC